jgi:hypothetical protein
VSNVISVYSLLFYCLFHSGLGNKKADQNPHYELLVCCISTQKETGKENPTSPSFRLHIHKFQKGEVAGCPYATLRLTHSDMQNDV